MIRRMVVRLVAGALLCLTLNPAGRPAQRAVDTTTWTDQQKEEYLLNAEIGDMREVGTGITRSRRAELSDGTVTHDAHIQTIDDYQARFEGGRGVELNFTDNYRYNIAAYRLDRLLGLHMVPVSVERRVAGDRAAVTWWVDDVQMMMLEYKENNLQPPDILSWNDQSMHVRLFNELVYNTDANLGNFLITNDWDIWMVDFTRAFRISETLRAPTNLENIRISRGVFEALAGLDIETLDTVMEDLLTDRQKRALLARRDLIVAALEKQIEQRGEAGVLRD